MEVKESAVKNRILERAGYRYNFDRAIYLNRRTKKAFSVEFVEDHSPVELQKCIDEESSGTEWRFFFNSPPSDAVKRELATALG